MCSGTGRISSSCSRDLNIIKLHKNAQPHCEDNIKEEQILVQPGKIIKKKFKGQHYKSL